MFIGLILAILIVVVYAMHVSKKYALRGELEELEQRISKLENLRTNESGERRIEMKADLSEDEVRKALDQVKHPAIDHTLIELGIVKEVSVIGNSVTITLAFPSAGIPIEDRLINSVREPVEELGVEVEVKTTLMNPEEVQKFLAMEQEAWKGLSASA